MECPFDGVPSHYIELLAKETVKDGSGLSFFVVISDLSNSGVQYFGNSAMSASIFPLRGLVSEVMCP
jgi:hypothetical protein